MLMIIKVKITYIQRQPNMIKLIYTNTQAFSYPQTELTVILTSFHWQAIVFLTDPNL